MAHVVLRLSERVQNERYKRDQTELRPVLTTAAGDLASATASKVPIAELENLGVDLANIVWSAEPALLEPATYRRDVEASIRAVYAGPL